MNATTTLTRGQKAAATRAANKAHQVNLDAAQREIDARQLQGEDMSQATIDPVTYAILMPTPMETSQQRLERVADELEAGIDRAPTNEEAAAGPEVQIDDDAFETSDPTSNEAFIAQVAAELDTTPEDAHITLTPTGYVGPMLALRERLAAGAYKKAANGQPCCGDEIAIALGSLTPAQVIRACIIAMNLPNNPYTHLNIGQQSMNLRNKLRGCMKRGEFGMGVVVEAVEVVVEADQA